MPKIVPISLFWSYHGPLIGRLMSEAAASKGSAGAPTNPFAAAPTPNIMTVAKSRLQPLANFQFSYLLFRKILPTFAKTADR